MSTQLSRKHFLSKAIQSGLIVSVPLLLDQCSSSHSRIASSSNPDPLQAASEIGYQQPILAALLCGITAPSPHNVQPWLFRIQSPSSCLLYVDPNRLLPLTDPPARQIHIGQGTFLEHLALGAAQLGHTAQIKILPEGRYNPLQPNKPVASITLIKNKRSVGEQDQARYDAIKTRATHRGSYDTDTPLTSSQVAAIQKWAAPRYTSLKIINAAPEMTQFNQAFFKAMQIECQLERTYEESRLWFRYTDKEIYSKRDGISLRGSGMSGFSLWLVRLFFGPGKEAWHDPANINAYLDSFQEALNSNQAIALLYTKSNRLEDWIKTGRDYARLHLAITHLGLVMQPLSQVLQEFPEMDQERNRFHELSQIQTGRIQMAVRIGQAKQAFISPRRRLAKMILSKS